MPDVGGQVKHKRCINDVNSNACLGWKRTDESKGMSWNLTHGNSTSWDLESPPQGEEVVQCVVFQACREHCPKGVGPRL